MTPGEAAVRDAVLAGIRWAHEAPTSFSARKSWWAELAPLTAAERATVRTAVQAALTAPRVARRQRRPEVRHGS